MTKVLIVSDVTFYREGLANALSCRSGIEIVGGVSNCQQDSLREVALLQPNVVLLDMRMSHCMPTLRNLRKQSGLEIIALALHESEEDILECAEAGISAYISCDGTLEELASTILKASQGESSCPPRVSHFLLKRISELAGAKSSDPAPFGLTGRENQVGKLIQEGRSNKEISQELYIEVSTVKNHLHHMFEKAGVHRRSELALLLERQQ